MEDLTDDEKAVFDDMVRRNLMEMYAKERANEIMQERKRKMAEEEYQKELKKKQECVENFTKLGVDLASKYMQRIDDPNVKLEISKIQNQVNRQRNKVSLEPINIVTRIKSLE